MDNTDKVILAEIWNYGEEHHTKVIIPDGKFSETMEFLHKTIFIPVAFNLLKLIKNGNIITWTDLKKEYITKYLLKSEETAMGNLDET